MIEITSDTKCYKCYTTTKLTKTMLSFQWNGKIEIMFYN